MQISLAKHKIKITTGQREEGRLSICRSREGGKGAPLSIPHTAAACTAKLLVPLIQRERSMLICSVDERTKLEDEGTNAWLSHVKDQRGE